MNNKMNRRGALKISAIGAVAGTLPVSLNAADENKKTPQISLQLYSIRDMFKKEKLPQLLKKISDAGFDGVEFWKGARYMDYQKNPDELKKIMEDLNLKAAGTHVPTRTIEKNEIKKTIDFHKAIGCKFIIIPGDGRFANKKHSKQYAEIFNNAAEIMKPEGLFCGYHNHTKEMKKAEGDKLWWDLFAERTSKDVMLQQEVEATNMIGMID